MSSTGTRPRQQVESKSTKKGQSYCTLCQRSSFFKKPIPGRFTIKLTHINPQNLNPYYTSLPGRINFPGRIQNYQKKVDILL